MGSADCLGDHALKTKLAGVCKDEFAAACLLSIELKTGLACEQRLEQRLAVDEWKPRGVLAVEMQEMRNAIRCRQPRRVRRRYRRSSGSGSRARR
jgi:hypothetical protein